MKNKTTMLLLLLISLSGCSLSGIDSNFKDNIVPSRECKETCSLVVFLAKSPKIPPVVDTQTLNIDPDAELIISVFSFDENQSEVTLNVSGGDPFCKSGGQQCTDTIVLSQKRPGVFKINPTACPPSSPCKYSISNTGNPRRSPTDPVIIVRTIAF